MIARVLGALVALIALGSACTSDGSDSSASDEAESETPQILRDEDAATADDGTALSVTTEPTPTPAPQGVVVNPFELVTGDCFNEYVLVDANDVPQDVTTALDCNLAHDGEVYFHLFYPGDAQTPFPGESKLGEWAQEQCFNEFEAFVGQAYELSELEIGVILPTLETWTGPGLHRQVTCYVMAWRGGQLQGSMRGTSY